MENETMSGIALVVAIVAFVAVLGLGTYAYLNQPEEVDLSGIVYNKIAINALGNDIEDLQERIDELSIPYISNADMDDIEDIDGLKKDIKYITRCAEGYYDDYSNPDTDFVDCMIDRFD